MFTRVFSKQDINLISQCIMSFKLDQTFQSATKSYFKNCKENCYFEEGQLFQSAAIQRNQEWTIVVNNQ